MLRSLLRSTDNIPRLRGTDKDSPYQDSLPEREVKWGLNGCINSYDLSLRLTG